MSFIDKVAEAVNELELKVSSFGNIEKLLIKLIDSIKDLASALTTGT